MKKDILTYTSDITIFVVAEALLSIKMYISFKQEIKQNKLGIKGKRTY